MDLLLEKIILGGLLSKQEIKEICAKSIEIMINEPNIPNVYSPVNVCGDIHGQFYDLLSIFKIDGSPKHKSYVFLGDYVDRGYHSVECLSLLMLYKIMYPENIILVRGNHEGREISKVYGFYDEVIRKYGCASVWRMCCDVFDTMCVGCCIDGRILCVHGGLSPKVLSLNQLKRIFRFKGVGVSTEYSDITWSDPSEKDGFSPNPRGAGYLYGGDVTKRFLELNDLTHVIRSHQLVFEGYKQHFPEKCVVTVWSAPNYCYRCGNLASFLRLNGSFVIEDKDFCVFKDVPQEPSFNGLPQYFK
jgi:serine/threonine-protein phosphatase 4 catalytic subunit/serine/threonine-protein phosphatase PP1-1